MHNTGKNRQFHGHGVCCTLQSASQPNCQMQPVPYITFSRCALQRAPLHRLPILIFAFGVLERHFTLFYVFPACCALKNAPHFWPVPARGRCFFILSPVLWCLHGGMWYKHHFWHQGNGVCFCFLASLVSPTSPGKVFIFVFSRSRPFRP